jgi:hypothetical protein
MHLSPAITLLITTASLSTSRAFRNGNTDEEDEEDDKVNPAPSFLTHRVGLDKNFFLGSHQQQTDVISSSSPSSPSSILPRPKGLRLLNKGNFMIGKQRLASQGRMYDADIGILEYGPNTQYLHNQRRYVEEDEGSSNFTTPFDYAYYLFCTYLNCTCSDINWAEQTMSAYCDRPGNTCSNAIYVCLAENGNPTNSCVYEVSQTLKITGPNKFENSVCKIRSSPYYEKTCWYYAGENVSYLEGVGLDYDIKECSMSFNGEICNSCTPVPTKFEYCYTDGNCTNGTLPCNEFDCTNTAQGKVFFKN